MVILPIGQHEDLAVGMTFSDIGDQIVEVYGRFGWAQRSGGDRPRQH